MLRIRSAAAFLPLSLLFLLLIWGGYDSPWKSMAFWGDYTLHETIKTWVIAVLVIGTLTLLGSLYLNHDFTFALADGSEFALSAEQKPVYLVFWAEW